MRLRNLNVAPRSALFFALIITLVFILGAVAVVQMGGLRDSEKDVETNWMASVRQTALMSLGVMRLRLEVQRSIADPEGIQKTAEAFPGFQKAFMEAVANYEPLVASDQERGLYLKVKASADAYSRQLDVLEPLMKRADLPAIASLNVTAIRPVTTLLEEQIKDLTDTNNEGAALAGRNATHLYATGFWLVVGLIAAVVILTVGLAIVLTRSITSPISDALSVAERIAGSDLSKEVRVSGTDEAGRLLKALAQMQNNLRNTIVQISESSTQLASAAEEMTAVTE